MTPGEYDIQPGDIELDAGRRTPVLSMTNTGGRSIQVGSHYHSLEVSNTLAFDRPATRGMRLNIAAGTTVRFESGQSREVELAGIGGGRRVYDFAGQVTGDLQGPSPANQVRGKTANIDDRQRSVR